MSKWTEEQLDAIKSSGTNIIVSAGAGSGKTAVLTERVITKLENTSIDKLLVLTFTNAAAAEMKERIRKAIEEKENLKCQLDYMDSAYITTFDSFAHSIVKKYHYLLNIPSNIEVVDNTIISIEINRIVDEIFERSYGEDKFNKFISSYCVKDDNNLRDFIIKLNDKLDLKIDKVSYLNDYISNNFNESYINDLVDEYTKFVMEKRLKLIDLYNEFTPYLNGKQLDAYKNYVSSIIDNDTYDEIIKPDGVTNPIIRRLDEEAKELKDKIKTLKDSIKSEKYTKEELKNNLLLIKDNVEVIISIIKELDERLTIFKKENNAYTFNDIAKMSIEILNNEDVREELKNFFEEIMVDEYQDTNDIQEEFISRISNNNVYMVGDIKQSIYRFRYANPKIFKDKYDNYSKGINGKKIDLLKNFRSREEVLKNINTIFDYIMDDNIGSAEYKKSHRMVHGNTMYDLKYNTDYNMDILCYDKGDDYKYKTNAEVEAFIIANDIKNKVESKYQVIDKETKKLRDVNYGDFAIIMDRGRDFDVFSKILEYNNIPSIVWNDEKLNVEDDIAILKNIVNLIIKVKENTFDKEFKYYFTSIARSYLFQYDDNKILSIFIDNKFKDDIIYVKALKIAAELDYMTNNELLDSIIAEFNIYENSIKNGNVEASMVRYDIFSNLFSSLSKLGYTPYDLPLYFKNSKDLDIKYSLNTKVPNNVNILNIHKSKGLEFSICYYAGIKNGFNNQDIKDKFLYDSEYGIIIPFNNGLGIGDTILRKLYINKYKKEDISEKIRLFYVALTRAKEHMIIVSPVFKNESVYKDIVDDDVRLSYKSIYDMLNSVNYNLKEYIKDVNLDSIGITDAYKLGKDGILPDIFTSDKEIKHLSIQISNDEIEEAHFSKNSHKLYNKEEISNMEFGTYMHYLFETTDFKQSNNEYIDNFIKQIDLGYTNIYKEYEFIYEEDSKEYHGVIDLMLEYQDHIDIYDYKLKNVLDDAYQKQLLGYKKYIENKTKKTVNTYLYSMFDTKIRKIEE
nr:UvrD-helicase domain-containing protein [Bacilli bacterium]